MSVEQAYHAITVFLNMDCRSVTLRPVATLALADIGALWQQSFMKTALPIVIAGAVSILLSASTAACKQGETLMLLAGDEAALTGFEKAGSACHVEGISRIPAEAGKGTWIRVAGSPSQIGSKPLNCVAQYVMNHLSGQHALLFIGNAAR